MAEATQNSRNPANDGSLSGALREVLGKFLAGVDDMLPAVVIDYDRTENRATVRPLIRILKTDNTLTDRAEVASVPVLNLGGGSIVLSFNIVSGDLGWIKASDRDISLFLQSESDEDVAPNTLRKHNFSDSLFIPDQFRNWTLDPEDDESAVLQTVDGLQRISIGATGVRLTSDNLIRLDAPVTTIIGDIFHVGNMVTFGSHTVGVDVIAGVPAVSLKNHLTTLVVPGGGTSGPPV